MRKILLALLVVAPLIVFADRMTKKTQTVVVPIQSSQVLLAQNKNRKGLIVSNNGVDAILLQFGTGVTSTTNGMTVPTATSVQFTNVPMDAVYVQLRASTGVNNVGVIEFE